MISNVINVAETFNFVSEKLVRDRQQKTLAQNCYKLTSLPTNVRNFIPSPSPCPFEHTIVFEKQVICNKNEHPFLKSAKYPQW